MKIVAFGLAYILADFSGLAVDSVIWHTVLLKAGQPQC